MAKTNPDVVVVGAGAFGAWTALSLVEAGAQVLLVDARRPGNPASSSGGESRNIRAAYGTRSLYTRWSMRAWDAWLAREKMFGTRLLYPSGSLRLLSESDAALQSQVFDEVRQPHELLTTDEVRARWPQIVYDGDETVLFEPKSGTVLAEGALVAVTDRIRVRGGSVAVGHVAPPRVSGDRLPSVSIDGEPVFGGNFVFACGPWLPQIFPDLIGPLIKTPRRELFFVAPLPGDERYRWDHCPSLADPLGWTSSDIGGGLKVAPIIRHVPMDPDHSDRMPTPSLVKEVRSYLSQRLPGLAERPIIQTFVSQLENTDNEHFLIDRHPEWSNVVIAGGGSGHAFKMGPVIGEEVAALVLGLPRERVLEHAFAAHGPVAADQGG